MSRDLDPDRDDSFLAAEYALGVLPFPDRRRVERQMRRDAELAAEVEAWEERLGPLAHAVEPVTPPHGLWQAIEAELPALRTARTAASGATTAIGRRVSAFWQWLAIGSIGLAAASLAGLALSLQAPAPRPTFTASIAGENGLALFTVVVDPADGQATLVPVSMGSQAGRVPELWFIPAGGAPISLGVVDPTTPLRIDLRREGMDGMGMMNDPASALAVSLEPMGGSPTGQPTGPVVGQGHLRSV